MKRNVRPVWGVAAVLAAALGGCSSGEVGEPAAEPRTAGFAPAHFERDYSDGRIAVRYPKFWSRTTSDRFGVVLGDNSERHAGFVSVRYLRDRELPARTRFAAFAADVIRPGGRLLHLYTQAARIGGRQGHEAGFIWPLAGTRGPLMRAYGFDRGPHGLAFLVFASEQPERHASDFSWVKRTIVWLREPGRERRPARPGGSFEHGY